MILVQSGEPEPGQCALIVDRSTIGAGHLCLIECGEIAEMPKDQRYNDKISASMRVRPEDRLMRDPRTRRADDPGWTAAHTSPRARYLWPRASSRPGPDRAGLCPRLIVLGLKHRAGPTLAHDRISYRPKPMDCGWKGDPISISIPGILTLSEGVPVPEAPAITGISRTARTHADPVSVIRGRPFRPMRRSKPYQSQNRE